MKEEGWRSQVNKCLGEMTGWDEDAVSFRNAFVYYFNFAGSVCCNGMMFLLTDYKVNECCKTFNF